MVYFVEILVVAKYLCCSNIVVFVDSMKVSKSVHATLMLLALRKYPVCLLDLSAAFDTIAHS